MPERLVTISDAWGIGGIPNGGYLGYVVCRALGEVLPHPHPFTVTTHYLRPAMAAPATIDVELVRAGKAHSTGMAKLIQEGKEVLRTLATFGDLDASQGETYETAILPELPPIEECERVSAAPPGSTFAERVDVRFAPGSVSFLGAGWTAEGVAGARMELGGWLRLRDGTEPDPSLLVLLADALPPPVLHAVRRRWVPTLELTVHVKRKPAPGWLRAWFKTRSLVGGYLEEDGELWDSSGKLVAISRQLARLS